jgi:hypothetical protein
MITAINDLDTPTGQREYKAYATLAARYAMQGCELIKSDPAIDGPARYIAMRWGSVAKPLADLDAAGDYLAKLERGAGSGSTGRRGRP